MDIFFSQKLYSIYTCPLLFTSFGLAYPTTRGFSFATQFSHSNYESVWFLCSFLPHLAQLQKMEINSCLFKRLACLETCASKKIPCCHGRANLASSTHQGNVDPRQQGKIILASKPNMPCILYEFTSFLFIACISCQI